MTNKRRENYPGATFHITARGNHRNDIFRDEEDFQVYCSFLECAINYFKGKFQIYCYCLMNNHVHILMKTEDIHIGYFIARVHSIYARYFNTKYKYIGHLYQDRYHTEIIEDDAQLLTTSRYIHLNPVRANMVDKPEEYKWSSYSIFIGVFEDRFTVSQYILSHFKRDDNKELYRKFVESALKTKTDRVLGGNKNGSSS
ncbi:REP-associated tyrosine transposase [Clostridium sp.]|uniref:REP-associated tyrosine transposase n=1 Tax=Clostridium sp. TaxID=1506 RepID=UPI003D6D7A53